MLPRRQVPNALTLLRLAFAGGFFLALEAWRYADGPSLALHAAIVLFVIAAVTDALDGYLARRWRVVSAFGRIMDPFCDKVLVLGAFAYLAGPRFVVAEWAEAGRLVPTASAVVPAVVVILLARELLVTAVRGVAESMGIAFPARAAGKIKMILQSVGVPVILLVTAYGRPDEHGWAFAINASIVLAITVATLWSGWPYILAVRPIMRGDGGDGGDGGDAASDDDPA
jgi:CDP-diacylglycerol--glycerol-3-phosphate 3-phosphatidyltransferase